MLSVKNIVMVGFGDITLLDLDTIDLSNLNRQFLFRKKDVKQSKARVSNSSLFRYLLFKPCNRLLLIPRPHSTPTSA